MAVILEKRNLRGLVIDAVVEEDHSSSSTVTNHPVSTESPISDHMIRQPVTFSMRGIIKDKIPCIYIQGERRPRNLEDAPLFDDGSTLEDSGTPGINNFGSSTTFFDSTNLGERTRAAWARIEELQDNKEIITLVTNLKVYENMVVESARTQSNAQNTEELDFEITLRQIKRVEPKQSTIRKIEGKNKGSKDTGSKSPPCLRLRDVFLDSGTTTNSGNQNQANTTDSKKIRTRFNNVVSPFTFDKWENNVCGAINKRWIDKYLPDITLAEEFSKNIRGNRANVVQVTNNQTEVERRAEEQAILTRNLNDLCNMIKDIDYCNIVKDCGDAESVPPKETEAERKSRLEKEDEARKKAIEDKASGKIPLISINRNSVRDSNESFINTLRSANSGIQDNERLLCYQEAVSVEMIRHLRASNKKYEFLDASDNPAIRQFQSENNLRNILEDDISQRYLDFREKTEKIIRED
jgi:hypothetical protein